MAVTDALKWRAMGDSNPKPTYKLEICRKIQFCLWRFKIMTLLYTLFSSMQVFILNNSLKKLCFSENILCSISQFMV